MSRIAAGGVLMALALHVTGAMAQQFGEAVRPAAPAPDRAVLMQGAPLRALADGAELVVVSGYEPSRESAGTARVILDRPGAKVLLLLSNHNKTAWELEVTPGTQLAGVVAGGSGETTVSGLGGAPGYAVKRLPYAYSVDNRNFVALLTYVQATFGRDRVDAFRGSYTIPGQVKVSAPDAPGPELTLAGPAPQKPARHIRFELPSSAGRKVPWSLAGPVQAGVVFYGDKAVSDGRLRYRLAGHALEITDDSGKLAVPPLPANFPPFSWPTALAYDSKRKLLTIVTMGGEGYMYRLDAKKQSWHDLRSLANIDLLTLAYDERADRYLAWSREGELLLIGGDGQLQTRLPLAGRLAGYKRLYDGGNESPPALQLAGRGDDVVLYYLNGNAVHSLWHLDLRTREATLTYRDTPPGGN